MRSIYKYWIGKSTTYGNFNLFRFFSVRRTVGSKNKSGNNTECGLNTTTQKAISRKALQDKDIAFRTRFGLGPNKRRIRGQTENEGRENGQNQVTGEWF
jgi:hypothetical protein